MSLKSFRSTTSLRGGRGGVTIDPSAGVRQVAVLAGSQKTAPAYEGDWGIGAEGVQQWHLKNGKGDRGGGEGAGKQGKPGKDKPGKDGGKERSNVVAMAGTCLAVQVVRSALLGLGFARMVASKFVSGAASSTGPSIDLEPRVGPQKERAPHQNEALNSGRPGPLEASRALHEIW